MKCSSTENLTLKGIPASPGIAIGRILILDIERIPVKEIDIEGPHIEAEVARFETAVDKTKKDFASIQKKIAEQLGEEKARIFDAHLLMLEDTMAIDETIDRIKEEKKNAEFIFFQNLDAFLCYCSIFFYLHIPCSTFKTIQCISIFIDNCS